MPNPVVAITAGASIYTSYQSSKAQSGAAEGASQAQLEATRMSIEEQRRQFETTRKLLEPYTRMGQKAVQQQGVIAGLEGPEAQQKFIEGITDSPLFKGMVEQGESALLQSASATGGLRGGNIQGALSQFRPAMVSGLIDKEFQRLGGLTGTGQASAAGVGAAAQQTGANVSNLITQGGQATAGNILAQGKIKADQWGNIGQNIGIIAGGF